MKKIILAIGIILAISLVVFLVVKSQKPPIPTLQPVAQDVFLELLNGERNKNGLEVLTTDKRLTMSAQRKAEDMAKTAYFSHTSPSGTTMIDWIIGEGYACAPCGENLARGKNTSAEEIVRELMNSEGHRENILNPKFKNLGVGIAKGDLVVDGIVVKDILYIVTHFGAKPI